MNYLNNSSQWEEFFIQEALELEEKMKTLAADALNKSKIRICLESNILDWSAYEKWYMSKLGCSSLKSSVRNEEIEKFVTSAQIAKEAYALYDFWSEDLIPLFTWDNQLIILGLQYNEKLVALDQHIFILAPPRLLSYLALRLASSNKKSATSEELSFDLDSDSESAESSEDGRPEGESEDDSASAPEGINLNVEAPKFSFNLIQPLNSPGSVAVAKSPPPTDAKAADAASARPAPPVSATPLPPLVAVTPQPVVSESSASPAASMFSTSGEAADGIWDFISERHQEYSFEIKKQFDAFVVLKVNSKKTQVFKMDADLGRQGVNHMIFEYNLETDGPFKNIFESGRSDTFSMKQLDMYLGDFQQACITPLRRGNKTVGFFVGFKKSAMSQKDKVLLEELAEESAS